MSFDPFRFSVPDLAFNHYSVLDVRPGNTMRNFGLESICAADGSGHVHVAQRVLPDSDDKPVVLWDEEEYHGQTVAPAADRWVSGYLACFGGRVWGALREHVEDLFDLAREVGDAALPAVLAALLEGRRDTAELYELSAPGSYLARAHWLRTGGRLSDMDAWRELLAAAPRYNAPLAVLMERAPTPELALELFRRCARYDLGNSTSIEGLYRAAAQILVREAPQPDSPYWPMIERIAKSPRFWRGAEGFYRAGLAFRDRGELVEAATCFENAIHRERVETEDYHHDAFKAIASIADRLSDSYARHVRALL